MEMHYTGPNIPAIPRTVPAEYVCEKIPAARVRRLTIPAVTIPAPVAGINTTAAIAYSSHQATVADQLDTLAQRVVRSVCKALIAKSGLSAGTRRLPTWPGKLTAKQAATPNNGHNEAAAVVDMRNDIREHCGTLTPNGDGTYIHGVGYWSKLVIAVDAWADADNNVTIYEGLAAQYRKAAAAAKRAGNMEQYDELTAAEKSAVYLAKQSRRGRAQADAALVPLVHEYTIGAGVDLYQIAALYLWERLAVDGLTLDSLLTGTAANGRKSIKTVMQWACILVRRAIRDNGRMMDQTAAGYTYFADGVLNETAPENVGGQRVRRAPKSYDVDFDGDGTRTTADSVDRLQELVVMLELSPTQEKILAYRLRGLSRDAIAEKLGVARGTLNKQMLRIAEKARNTLPADLLAKYGIIEN